MNEKDVKKCEVCEIQNVGLASAYWDLQVCIDKMSDVHISIALLEGIRNNLEVYNCGTTKKLIKRVQFTLSEIRSKHRQPITEVITGVITEADKVLLKMLLNELHEVIGDIKPEI